MNKNYAVGALKTFNFKMLRINKIKILKIWQSEELFLLLPPNFEQGETGEGFRDTI